jgi:Ethanolamine utilization protein EutJ (predicted chaperonin)
VEILLNDRSRQCHHVSLTLAGNWRQEYETEKLKTGKWELLSPVFDSELPDGKRPN